jgi:hypothetical protein
MANSYSGSSYQNAPNSTMAIVSLVAGILGLTLVPFLGSVVALIVGYMAKNEIKASNGAIGGEGLTTAGLIMGWIGVALGVVGCCIFAAIFLVPLILVPLFGDFSGLLPLMQSLI